MSDVRLTLSDDVLDQLAQRVADLLEQRRSVQLADPTTWLSPREVATLHGVSLKTVLAAIHDGRLAAENWAAPGKRPRYRVSVNALDELRVRAREPVEPPAATSRGPRHSRGRFSRLAREASYDQARTRHSTTRSDHHDPRSEEDTT